MKQTNSMEEKYSNGLVCPDCIKEHCEHCRCEKCMNQTNNWEEVDKRFDERYPFDTLVSAHQDWTYNDLKHFIHQELTNLLKTVAEANYKMSKKYLTEDISHAKFIDDGRKMWSVKGLKGRGIDPCYECENRNKIIKYLESIEPSQIISNISEKYPEFINYLKK